MPRRGGSQTRPPILLPQRLDLEQSGAPVWSSCPGRLDFGATATAAAARLRGQSLSFPRLTVTGSPPELGPRKFRGSGGERTGGGGELVPDGDVSLPRRSFGFFPIAGKETRPAGRNPVRRRAESSRPTGVTVHGRRAGQETRPYGEPLAFPRHGGRGKPLTYGVAGKHSVVENWRAATWGRPYGISGGTQQNGAAHLKNPQKPLQLFPVLYSNISQKPGYVTIMTQYYGFVTLRPNPLTGGLH